MALSLLNRPDPDRCRDAVARLTARLEQHRRVAAVARRNHTEAALDAESGDKAAAGKAERTKRALASALADADDTAAMLEAARGRLAAAERRAEAERIAEAWQRTEALCSRRDALAKRIDDQMQAMRAIFPELAVIDGELLNTVPVPSLRTYGVGTGPGGVGATALANAFSSCLTKLGRTILATPGGARDALGFHTFVADRSAAVLSLRAKAAAAADAADAASTVDALT